MFIQTALLNFLYKNVRWQIIYPQQNNTIYAPIYSRYGDMIWGYVRLNLTSTYSNGRIVVLVSRIWFLKKFIQFFMGGKGEDEFERDLKEAKKLSKVKPSKKSDISFIEEFRDEIEMKRLNEEKIKKFCWGGMKNI